MFEDNKQNKNLVPDNLPTSGPAAPTTPPAPSVPSEIKEPVDILGEVDQAEPEVRGPSTAPSFGQESSQSSGPVNVPPAMPPSSRPVAKEPVFGQKRKVVAAILGIIIIGVLASAAWYGYNLIFSGPSVAPDVELTDSNLTNTQPDVDLTNEAIDLPIVPEVPPEEIALDSDKDGLTDQEEELYGTNPFKLDTDLDGLTDRDEVVVFKTDPNNPDSDGDTFLDGAEVRSGYDPKGPGRLLELAQ